MIRTGSDLFYVSREALHELGRARVEDDLEARIRHQLRYERGLVAAAIRFVWSPPDARDPRGLWRVAAGWVSRW